MVHVDFSTCFLQFNIVSVVSKILFVFASCALSQVLEMEQQHSTALQELSHTYTAEKERLIEQHQLQLQVCVIWRLLQNKFVLYF